MSDEERRRSASRERSPVGDRERHHETTDRQPEEPKKEEFKCFVGGIPWHVNDSTLREIFADFNPTDATVMLEKRSLRSRGFGFVWFANETLREAAIERHHGTEIEGRKVSVSKAIPQSQTAPGTPADALRRGHTVPRDQGRVRRNGRDRSRDRSRDRRAYSSGGGGGGSSYHRDRDDRGRDSYRDYYDRDRSYRGSGGGGGYDREYDRGGYGGTSYRPGYGYERGPSGGPSDTYDRGYDRGYDERRPAYGGGSDRYYEPYIPRDSYEARPPASRYEPAPQPSYYGGGGGGDDRYGAPPPRETYGSDSRYAR